MRTASLSLLAATAFWVIGLNAQESTGGVPEELLCEQCPWDAPVRIRRDSTASPNATQVVTAEDLRNLGVIGVADMVNQLPNEIGADAGKTSGSKIEATSDPGAGIDSLGRLRNESPRQPETADESGGTPTDDGLPPDETRAEE